MKLTGVKGFQLRLLGELPHKKMAGEYPQAEIDELKKHCLSLSDFFENNIRYFYLEGLLLPDGCSPTRVDALFCPVDRGDGYPSRLFFPESISSGKALNWHVNNQPLNVTEARIAEKNWWAYSWKVTDPNRPLQVLLREHLSAFVRGQNG